MGKLSFLNAKRVFIKTRLERFCFILFVGPLISFGQSEFNDEFRGNEAIRIGFYNTENLFDPEDDSTKRDEQFTPEGSNHWDKYRYWDKQKKLSKVVLALGGWEAPAVMAFCEIENKKVLEYMVYETPLEKMNYSILHYESPDRRGIDVGLIYRKEKVKLIYSKAIAIHFPWDENYKTRDILYAQMEAYNKDTVHLFINHWPSRWRGQMETDKSRRFVASVLKHTIDSIQKDKPKAKIVIMGDFNDSPTNGSMSEVLNARKDTINTNEKSLINLMFPYEGKKGTHKYQGEWAALDQIIVSKSLLDGQGTMKVKNNRGYIFSPDFLLIDDQKYQGKKVNRTYIGMKYQGGYSDHLPIYLDLEVN